MSQVPLGEKFNRFIAAEKQLTPAKLVQQLRAKKYEVWSYCHSPVSKGRLCSTLKIVVRVGGGRWEEDNSLFTGWPGH